MSDQTTGGDDIKKVIIGGLCGGITGYILTQCSLHGVSFTTFGVDSEIVKGAITATLTGFIMAPITLIYKLRDFILWVYKARQIICDAVHGKRSMDVSNKGE